MKLAVLRCTVAAAVILAGCAQQSAQHKGVVLDPQLAAAIQPGVDNKDSVEKTARPAELHRPVHAQRLVLCLARHQPGRVPQSERDEADRNDRPLRPEGQRRLGSAHRQGAGDERRPERRKTPTLGRQQSFFEELFGNIGSVGAPGLPGSGGGPVLIACRRASALAAVSLKRRAMTATPAGMTYADYLKLDQLLSAQQPLSDLHDEMLFIIIHQTKELWMKELLHELRLAVGLVGEDRFAEAYKAMARISRIQAVMTLSWDVLSTLTPGRLSEVSRRARYVVRLPVGAVPRNRVPARAQGAELRQPLCRRQPGARRAQKALTEPSLREASIEALERAGFDLGDRSVEAVAAAWLEVYRDAERWFDLYELAEKLVDIDDALAAWRHKHVLTVERIIGNKRGHRRLGRRALSSRHARKAGVPGAVGAEDRSLSFKRLFSRSLGADPERLHFAAHSHHLWPDASFDGQIAGVERRRAARRPQVGQGDGRGLARSAGRGCAELGTRRAGRDRLRLRTPTNSWSACSPRAPRRWPIRVLTSDGEFHSARRQFARWEEAGWSDGRRVAVEPFDTFPSASSQRRRAASTTSSWSAR